MIKTGKNDRRLVPDPQWLPLLDGLFHYTSTTEIDLSRFWVDGEERMSRPRALKPVAGSRVMRLVFEDDGWIEVHPRELMSQEFSSNSVHKSKLTVISRARKGVLESFSLALSKGRYTVFARFDDFRAGFDIIPSDNWLLYKVTDWSTGRAVAPDGREVWSIHVDCPTTAKPRSGRKPKYDQDQITGEVRRLFRKFGRFGADKEGGWQTRADLEEQIAQFIFDTTGQSPAKSTLQERVRKALQTIEAEQAK